MVDEATSAGLKVDADVLRAYPNPEGMQHDECKSGIFKYAGKIVRHVPNDAPLHPSVLARFALTTVLQFDEMKPYRPEALRTHHAVAHYYTA